MDFAKAITIVIAGELSPSMIHTLMAVSPALQTGINALLVGIHQCAWNDGVFDEGLDRLLLHIGQEMDHHLTATLQHPEDGRSFLRSCAPPTGTFTAASTAFSVICHIGVPLRHERFAIGPSRDHEWFPETLHRS